MRDFSASPVDMVGSLWRNRDLIKELTKREVLGRYRGSTFGLLWSFFNPLFMLAVYTFVFSVIFKARWNTATDSRTEFALVLFSGLIVFNLFAECINRAPTLILSNVNYVKKVVFPLEILPAVSTLSALFHATIGFVAWLAAYIVLCGMPHATILYLPFILLPFLLLIVGLGWLLASLGAYMRDVTQLTTIMVTVIMFLSPIFYPASALPEHFRHWIYLNPLAPVIEQVRATAYWGQQPDFGLIGIYWVVTFFIAWAGFAWFQKTRKGFADVL